jgi:hypothetical protein
MVGLTLTIGLYPLGFYVTDKFFPAAPLHLGPWLLPGLIPLGVGVALITSYYLEQSNLSSQDEISEKEKEEKEKKAREKVIPIKDVLEREKRNGDSL